MGFKAKAHVLVKLNRAVNFAARLLTRQRIQFFIPAAVCGVNSSL
jgi:hypothetical protein